MNGEVFLPALGVGVQPIGFGCCPMGLHGWGRVDEESLLGAVDEAFGRGIRLFDTADIYGFGTSETLLGKALRGRREQAVIATKFGVRRLNGRTFHDTSPAWLREAVESSLARLGTDYIDLYQMHYWDGRTPIPEIVAALEDLVAEGKIRAFGISNFNPLDPGLSGRTGRLSSYSYQYSLVDRGNEAKIGVVQAAGSLVFLSWGSLGQGILAGTHPSLATLAPDDRRLRKDYPNFHGERFEAIQKLLYDLELVRGATGARSLAQLALRWVIERFPRAIPLVGIKRPDQAADAAGALDICLGESVMGELDRLARPFLAPAPP